MFSPRIESLVPAGLSGLNMGTPPGLVAAAAGGWGSPSSAVSSLSNPCNYCRHAEVSQRALGICILATHVLKWLGECCQCVLCQEHSDVPGRGEPRSALILFARLLSCLLWVHHWLTQAALIHSVLILHCILFSSSKSILEADADSHFLSYSFLTRWFCPSNMSCALWH